MTRGGGCVLWFVSLGACTIQNPAWLDTEASGTPASTGASTTTTTGPVTTTTPTSDGATGAGTDATSGTSSAATSATSGLASTGDETTGMVASTSGDGSSGPDGTTGVMACAFQDSPDLELRYTTDGVPGCNTEMPRSVSAELLGQLGPNQWKFNVCADENACKNPQTSCAPGERIILTFEAPPGLMPEKLTVGTCHLIVMLPRQADPQDPQSCLLRMLRIADTRFTPAVNHFIGAIGVPGVAGLPQTVKWTSILGLDLVSTLVSQCDDPLNCQPAVGGYQYSVKWGAEMTEHVVLEGMSFAETITTSDPNQAELVVNGTFYDLRSRIVPGDCGTGQDFKWGWRATVP